MNDSRRAHWWVDASFAMRYQLQSKTGATLSMGFGSIYRMSRKQKLNITSLTEAKIVGAHDVMSQIVWFRHFLWRRESNFPTTSFFKDNKCNNPS
jgi:hypothetical protein